MLFPNAFTEMIKEEYRAFRKGADHSICGFVYVSGIHRAVAEEAADGANGN